MKQTTAPGPPLEAGASAVAAEAIVPARIADAGFDVPPSLPRDHPAWQRDALSVSARARAVLAKMRAVTVRALTFWDHVVRSVRIGDRRIEVDPSGCYRRR